MPKKPMPKKESKIEEAQRLLQEEHQKNVEKCNTEIQAVLEKYGMQIDARSVVQLIPR